jgi:hypothetical protein
VIRLAAAAALAIGCLAAVAEPAAAFDGFEESSADSTYGREIRFEVEIAGQPPEQVDLLLRTPGTDGAFVVPVDVVGDRATYVWVTSIDYVTPNTLVTYQWRAVDGDDVVLSDEATVRYEDDRPGLDWQTARLGETTVHWYGDAEPQAMRFGELAAIGVAQGEELLGTSLAGPVDVFVYDAREDFFGALGPGAREWIGAAAYPELRTIFMWLEGGSTGYLEIAMVHEITHIVFFDATDNPFHDPASWVNEGIASWSETRDGADARAFVARQAPEGLFAFEAIAEQFPIGDLGSSLAYAQGAAMIDFIIDRHGEEAIARLTAAYRDGASEAEALEAATGQSADELYADFYAEFGAEAPQPVEPEPIPPSEVEPPDPGVVDPGGVVSSPAAQPSAPGTAAGGSGSGGPPSGALLAAVALAIAAAVVLAIWVVRRARRADAA